jgi:hypothetical protein
MNIVVTMLSDFPESSCIFQPLTPAALHRNVRLMGDASSPASLYGAQVMVSTPARRPRAILRFTHVEVQWAGQAFRLGRYPIHFHMHGDAGMQSWVKGCSIHHSFQRAVTIHGTHRVLLENNVAYDIMGHTYFFEDALEWGESLAGLCHISITSFTTASCCRC